MMNINPNNLLRQYELYAKEYEQKAIEVLRTGWYVLGKEVRTFEQEWAEYCGSKYCVGLNSGLDALCLAFKVLGVGEGDEVIVQGNTYIASVMGVTLNSATPVFVEPDQYYGIDADKIEEKITDRTKAVLVVHLYGIPSEMDKIVDICKRHDLRLVEDCAQSHGAFYKGKMTGTFGDIGCFSFYPTKNLGAFGDGGAIITDNEQIASDVKMYRNYGSEKKYYNKVIGMNSRLDELQAGLLRVKLSHMDEITEERIRIARRYQEEIHNFKIKKPECRPETKCVWHQYVICCEDRQGLIEYLLKRGVGTIIHYPIPPHLSEAYASLGHKAGDFPITEKYADTVLSLPIYNGITEDEQTYIITVLNDY